MTHNPPTNQLDLDAIEARAARLYERTATIDPNAHPDFGQLTDADVPALVDEVRRLRAAQPVALPARWECANGPADDEPYCAEDGCATACPTIRVHPDDAEAFAALVTAATAPGTGPATPQTLCRTCVTPIGYIDAPTGGWWAHETHPADEHDAVPGAWVDGDDLMEAIAGTVWEHCERGGNSTVFDDPRNIAGTAAAVARRAIAAETKQLRRDRDLAIAHDRQPYPTAWAYEQACKALNRKTEAVDQVRAMHKPRTERHGSGCVQCGIVWPCPTYNALNEAVRPAVETGA